MAMSSGETHENVIRLLTKFNFQLEALPNDLKCGLCKSVLKNACRVPCGCRFCFNCISKEMADGVKFCPIGSEECAKTPLSRFVPKSSVDKSIARLIAKCPETNCSHKCPLADMEGHLTTCEKASIRLIKDDIKSMKDEIKLIKDENKAVKDRLESIEQEKEVLTDRVRQLSEQLEREIERRCESEENGSASLESGADWDALEMPVQLGRQIDISCDEWLIDADIGETEWGWGCLIAPKTGASFTAEAPSYTFQLASWNRPSQAALWIWLRIVASRCDSLLEWPFRGTITVTVADRDRHKVCSRQTRQCRIKMPLKKQFMSSDKFVFWHSELREAGLDLQRGVRVWCQVVSSDVAYPDNDDVMDITPIVNHHLLP